MTLPHQTFGWKLFRHRAQIYLLFNPGRTAKIAGQTTRKRSHGVPRHYEEQEDKIMDRAINAFFFWILGLAIFGAWLQHILATITQEAWGLLIAGAIFVPVGIVHGFGIWFGYWQG